MGDIVDLKEWKSRPRYTISNGSEYLTVENCDVTIRVASVSCIHCGEEIAKLDARFNFKDIPENLHSWFFSFAVRCQFGDMCGFVEHVACKEKAEEEARKLRVVPNPEDPKPTSKWSRFRAWWRRRRLK